VQVAGRLNAGKDSLHGRDPSCRAGFMALR
jgi:hypothetical protein